MDKSSINPVFLHVFFKRKVAHVSAPPDKKLCIIIPQLNAQLNFSNGTQKDWLWGRLVCCCTETVSNSHSKLLNVGAGGQIQCNKVLDWEQTLRQLGLTTDCHWNLQFVWCHSLDLAGSQLESDLLETRKKQPSSVHTHQNSRCLASDVSTLEAGSPRYGGNPATDRERQDSVVADNSATERRLYCQGRGNSGEISTEWKVHERSQPDGWNQDAANETPDMTMQRRLLLEREMDGVESSSIVVSNDTGYPGSTSTEEMSTPAISDGRHRNVPLLSGYGTLETTETNEQEISPPSIH